MSLKRLELTNRSALRATWLSRLRRKNNRIPAGIIRVLSNLSTIKEAQRFVKYAGLKVLPQYCKTGEVLYLISIEPPRYIRKRFSENLEYYTPQIILPRKKCEEFPGMVSMNFIFPKMSSLFPAYQARIVALSSRLQASPFAWIYGSISKDLIGYIFFFSSRPNPLYNKINILLKKQEALRSSTNFEEKLRLVEEINNLVSLRFDVPKEHPLYNKKVIYPLLGDNGFEDPLLIDFRQTLK